MVARAYARTGIAALLLAILIGGSIGCSSKADVSTTAVPPPSAGAKPLQPVSGKFKRNRLPPLAGPNAGKSPGSF